MRRTDRTDKFPDSAYFTEAIDGDVFTRNLRAQPRWLGQDTRTGEDYGYDGTFHLHLELVPRPGDTSRHIIGAGLSLDRDQVVALRDTLNAWLEHPR